jgi:hypothetical protein
MYLLLFGCLFFPSFYFLTAQRYYFLHYIKIIPTGNVAFGGMTVMIASAEQTITGGTATDINGLAKSKLEINADGTLFGLFTNDANPWTTANGKLPGFGAAVDMPAHLLPVSVPVITITGQPAANTAVTAGSISGSLSVTAEVTLGATLGYQWYSCDDAQKSNPVSIGGATSASFAIPTTLTAGTYYYFCEVSATGGASPVTSNVATVTVDNLVHAQAPVITTHPTGGTVNEGGSTTLTVTVNTVTDGGTLSYQWYSNTANSNSGGTLIDDATGASYTAPASTAGAVYYYVVQS